MADGDIEMPGTSSSTVVPSSSGGSLQFNYNAKWGKNIFSFYRLCGKPTLEDRLEVQRYKDCTIIIISEEPIECSKDFFSDYPNVAYHHETQLSFRKEIKGVRKYDRPTIMETCLGVMGSEVPTDQQPKFYPDYESEDQDEDPSDIDSEAEVTKALPDGALNADGCFYKKRKTTSIGCSNKRRTTRRLPSLPMPPTQSTTLHREERRPRVQPARRCRT
jgi:hypothetical protein